jgi:hypothetical protein
VFSPEAPIHPRIEAPEQFNRDTQPLVLDQARGELSVLSRKQHLWAGSHRFGKRGIPVEVRSVMLSSARQEHTWRREHG